MAETPDFHVGFAAGFKLGSDAADYKKQIDAFNLAKTTAQADQRRAGEMLDRASEATKASDAAQKKLAADRAAWEAQRDAERKKLDEDGDRSLAREQAVKRAEDALPGRVAAVTQREINVTEREMAIGKREAEAEAVKRRYEVLLQKQHELTAAA